MLRENASKASLLDPKTAQNQKGSAAEIKYKKLFCVRVKAKLHMI